jgi:exodeoxyribonuclease VII large subunit
MTLQRPDRDVYTVGRLNREVRLLLESGLPPVWVEGEISNFSAPASGHWYFTLKDRDAQIRCAMFRARNAGIGFRPKEGQLLQARGRVGLYEPRGDYQLIVEQLEDAGEGALKREFDRLKARLAAEGLFDAARKRALPRLPRRIAVVTSATGAALRDVLHILARRFPPAAVLIHPVPVQGAAAAAAIVAAIDEVSARAECDVLILARGGGSLEDLWCFNDERVARAIHRCAVPVVTGIGHETDFTIADFVADVRAPTPSGAAQLVVPDRVALGQSLDGALERLVLAVRRQLAHGAQRHAALAHRLQQAHPGSRLAQQAQRLDELEQRLGLAVNRTLASRQREFEVFAARLWRAQAGLHIERLAVRATELDQRLRSALAAQLQRLGQRLALAARGLEAVSPLAVLGRGYALVTGPQGKVIRTVTQLATGDTVQARFAAGRITAVVSHIDRDDASPETA